MLNEKQQKILDYIKGQIVERGFPPSVREISRAFKFASPRSAQKYLESLEAAGYLERAGVSRGIKIISAASEKMSDRVTGVADAIGQVIMLPFYGYIAAGSPIEVLDHQEEISVPAQLVAGRRGAVRRPCYVLQVKGDSMIEDHILNGDFIVVEQRDTADDGQVVVALVNKTSATLKRLYREKNRVRLEPANSAMQPIFVKDVAVQGVVRGLFRRL
ncbi:MAG: transcriptional repressor LexA [Candidatus Margulisiibacteriota bacterium]